MSDGARISVVIPAYNAARYLAAAIGSVLAQTLAASEIVVVDDGSSDASATIAGAFPGVRLLAKPHSGIAATRNHGIAAASGDFLAFLDADDLWLPEKLERQLAYLAQHPDCPGVFGQARQFVSPELAAAERARFHCPPEAASGQHAGTLLIRRRSFLDIGPFNEQLPAGEFIEWMLRARQSRAAFPTIDEVVMLRRIHGRNTVLTQPPALHRAYLQIVRQKLREEGK